MASAGARESDRSADLDPTVRSRVQVDVQLTVRGEKIGGGEQTAPMTRPVALFGPGDIVGIDRRTILRVEPRDWVTNFEPNYLAHIEFYDEDFPWRYTPAAADETKGRLRPWLTLLVLTEEEFSEEPVTNEAPLPSIVVTDRQLFPRADELWAWAHVHVNRQPRCGSGAGVARHGQRPAEVCRHPRPEPRPRVLAPRVSPEAGGEQGLSRVPDPDVRGRPARRSRARGWRCGGHGFGVGRGARPDPQRYPYYFRWHFRTGTSGDFETLVRLLTPKPVDRRVGTREVDMQFPGSTVRGVDKPELDGVLKLGGALRPPPTVPPTPPDVYDTWDDPMPRPLQEDLARLLNLPDDYSRSADPDPLLAPPLYGPGMP